MNDINKIVPKIENANANIDLNTNDDLAKISSDTKIPNWAEEIVAPVDGETKLFITNFCIINPDIDRAIPVRIIVISLGILDIIKVLNCSTSLKISSKLISIGPTKIDTKLKIINTDINNIFLCIGTPYYSKHFTNIEIMCQQCHL